MSYLRHKRFGMFQFMLNIPSSRLTEWTLDLWTTRKVWAVEMSCPWMEHREKKSDEKTVKYGPLRFELKKRYPGYDVEQCNIIIDVLWRMVKGCRPDNEEALWQRGL